MDAKAAVKDEAHFCNQNTGSKIFLSICPLLLAFGTCTNILSLLVLTRKRMRKHSTYLYLAILSVIDMLALYLGLIRDYLAHGYGIYINSTWLCRLHSFLFYYTLDFSSWILVAVSIDRFLAITFVFSSYTRQLLLKLLAKPKLICCIIGVFLFFLNLHFFFYIQVHEFSDTVDATTTATSASTVFMSTLKTLLANRTRKRFNQTATIAQSTATSRRMTRDTSSVDSDKFFSIGVSGEYSHCAIDELKHPLYAKFFQNTWPYVDLSVYAILPFCIMSICNIAIIKNAKFSTPSANIKSTSTLNVAVAASSNGINNNNQNNMTEKNKQNRLKRIENLKETLCCCLLKQPETHHHNKQQQKNHRNHKKKKFAISRFGNHKKIIKKSSSVENNIDYYTDENTDTNDGGSNSPNYTMSSSGILNGSMSLHKMPNASTNAAQQTQIIFTPTNLTSNNNSQARNIRMMTLTIIAVTCIFIILTLPIMLFIVIEKITTSTIIEMNDQSMKGANGNRTAYNHNQHFLLDPNCKSVIWSILNIFMYINHSINFVLYCLTGSKFRTELATLFVSPQVLVNAHAEQSPYSTSFRNFSSVRYSSIKIPPPAATNYVAMRTQSLLNGNTKL